MTQLRQFPVSFNNKLLNKESFKIKIRHQSSCGSGSSSSSSSSSSSTIRLWKTPIFIINFNAKRQSKQGLNIEPSNNVR
jgi:hypothetical protein